jgi:hypothetical protein
MAVRAPKASDGIENSSWPAGPASKTRGPEEPQLLQAQQPGCRLQRDIGRIGSYSSNLSAPDRIAGRGLARSVLEIRVTTALRAQATMR